MAKRADREEKEFEEIIEALREGYEELLEGTNSESGFIAFWIDQSGEMVNIRCSDVLMESEVRFLGLNLKKLKTASAVRALPAAVPWGSFLTLSPGPFFTWFATGARRLTESFPANSA